MWLSMRMKKTNEKKFVKVCPDCFSTQVTLTNRAALTVYRELYYRCRKCGLEAKVFPEVLVSQIKKLGASKKKRKKVKK